MYLLLLLLLLDDDDDENSVLLRQMVFCWERGKVERNERERDRHREAESHRDGAEDNEKKNFPK